MKKQLSNARFVTISSIILAAGAIRLIPQPFNVAPIGAMAIFGGACYGKKWLSFLIPLATLFISDLFVNYAFYHKFVPFHEVAPWVYGAFALNVMVGYLLVKKISLVSITKASLVGSILFFIITNFGVWALPGIMNMYPHTLPGLAACYVAGIPYFGNTLTGDLFYCGVMFGIFELAQRRFPVLAQNI